MTKKYKFIVELEYEDDATPIGVGDIASALQDYDDEIEDVTVEEF